MCSGTRGSGAELLREGAHVLSHGMSKAKEDAQMPTIVTYTDQRPPANRYPHQIISPPRAGACCFSEMEELGTPQTG